VSCTEKTIVDICFPLFKLVYNLNVDCQALDFQSLQSKVLQEFFNVEESLKSSGVSSSVCLDVKFVMSAFVDEMILKNGGDCAINWSQDSLQIKFFNENLGGEKFFERLIYLQRFSDKRFDILELYYWCLELGYQGKYANSQVSELKSIKENLRVCIKPNQLKIYESLQLKKTTVLCNVKTPVLRINKLSINSICIYLVLSGAIVYGAQSLVVGYFINKIALLSTQLE
jgi:type IV/VI secretion system ImpK/VasF family protein